MPVSSGMGLVRVIGNAELNRIEAEKRGSGAEPKPPVKELAGYVAKCWEYAKRNKTEIESKITKCQRQRKGEYEGTKLSEIQKHGGCTIYRKITQTKCTAIEGLINDTIPNSAKMFDLEPTPLPDLKPDIEAGIRQESMRWFVNRYMETGGQVEPVDVYDFACEMRKIYDNDMMKKARFAADKMRQKIVDQFTEGGFDKVLKEFVHDLATYPAAIVKGPVFRMGKTLKWEDDGAGNFAPAVSFEPVMQFERVSPYDFFPSPDCTDGQDGYVIERMKLSRKDLISLKGIGGYSEDEIDNVLKTYSGGLRLNESYDSTRDTLENKGIISPEGGADPGNVFDSLEFWGSVSGYMLKEWGLSSGIEDSQEYDVWLIMIGEYVIKCELNPDPLGKRPYYVTSYVKEPGVVWGMSPPELMEDSQDICNATIRALVNNLAIGSGPQVMVNSEALPGGENITSMEPWKIWQYVDPTGKFGGNAIQFHNIDVKSQELLSVYEKMKMESDEQTVPRYSYGNENVGGAASTARGLSMLFNAMNKNIKQVISNIDSDVIKPLVTYMYNWNMLNTQDPEIKGDLRIKPLGTTSLVIKEQMVSMRQEFLNNTLNPIDSQLIPPENRLKILREQVKELGMPEDSIIPSEFEMENRAKMAQMSAMQQAGGQEQMAGNPVQGGTPAKPQRFTTETGLPRNEEK